MIRKSAIILILIVAAFTGIFVFVLGDSFVQDLSEIAFSKILKTEVIIEGLDIELSTTKTSFQSLSIKDPDDISKSLAKTGPAEFDVLGMQLLAKKLVVTKMSLNDMVFDSELKKLDRESEIDKQSIETSVGKLADNLPELDLDVLAKELDIDQYVHPEKLKSITALKKAEKEAGERIAIWDKALKNSTIDTDIRQIQIDADKLRKSRLKTIQDYQNAITQLQLLETKSKQTVKKINKIHRNANKDLKFVTTNFGDIKNLTEQDIKDAEKLANLKEINSSHIGMMLFGKEFIGRYEQAVGYLNQARGYFGDKQEKPVRKAGRIINYPVTGIVYPEFLIQHLKINGQLTKQSKPLINWAGSITGLTVQQDITGKPTVFDISGDEIGKPSKYHIQGIFDNRGEKNTYNFTLKGTQLDLKQIEIKKNNQTWPDHMSSKDAELIVSLTISEKTMEGSILLVAHSIQFAFARKDIKGISETDQAVREIFEDMKMVRILSSIKGSLDDPQFSVSSNIDKILAKRLDEMVGKKIKDAQNKIRKKIENQVSATRKSAETRLNKQKRQVLKQVNAYQKQVTQEKKKLDKQVKAYEKKQKKALEDEARKKLESLFK